MLLGERLRGLRKEKGLSIQQVSDNLDCSYSKIALYESGKRNPDAETLKLLGNYFNVSVDYLLGLTDFKNGFNVKEVETDIQKTLNNLMQDIEKDSNLKFEGLPIDETTKELILQSLENSIKIAKAINKNKKNT